ncbi:MAG TPA: DUF6491 family protein [Steroidobacteraceae bacterium]|nr:DUF6491 family protein [Steroidobacteraceae bacterium]
MRVAIALTLLVAAALSACSGIPRRESDQQHLARIKQYTGDPVTEFHVYGAFNSWTPIDDQHVLVQTNLNEAYLIKVFGPCIDLPFATRIAITSRFPHQVQSGFDSVRVGRESCRISEIRPVNYRQMRADLAEERKSQG